jgi:hypothetical protein
MGSLAKGTDQEKYEARFRQLEQLVKTAPQDWGKRGEIPPDYQLWLGRVQAAVEHFCNEADKFALRQAAANVATSTNREMPVQTIMATLYRAFAAAEQRAPSGESGAFIGTGRFFDVFQMMAKALDAAAKDVLVVDPYIDEAFMLKFARLVPKGTSLRLLGLAKWKDCGRGLLPAVQAWSAEYGAAWPIESRRASNGLHNRYIFIDGGAAVWDIGQSIRNLVDTSPTGFNLIQGDLASEAVEYYEDAWSKAAAHV